MKKSAVVTGATGFIGSYLVKELASQGYDVLAVIRPGTENNFRLNNTTEIKTVECDLNALKSLPELTTGTYDYFFHLAWSGVSGAPTADYNLQIGNIQSALSAVEVSKALGCKRFIGAGSLYELECQKEMEQDHPVNNPSNAYKIAKLSANYYCKLKASAIGVDFFWPILTNVYGAGETSKRLINFVIASLLNNESPPLTTADQLYNFIYVSDAARAFRFIAEKGISHHKYVIGSEDVRPLRELLSEAQQIINPDIELGFGKNTSPSTYLKKSELYSYRLFQELGFTTETSFSEGIKETAQWIASDFYTAKQTVSTIPVV